MTQSVILVAHDLPADVRQHAMALAETGLLDQLFTGYVHLPTGLPERALNSLPGLSHTAQDWSKKRPPICGVADAKITRMPLRELAQTAAGLALTKFGGWLPANDYAKRALSGLAAQRLTPAHTLVIGREMEACESFARAKELGVKRLYQLPIAHHATMKRIFEREDAEFPDIAASLPTSQTQAPRRLARKDTELSLANVVLVPSQFVKESLTRVGVEDNRVAVIPFGCEPDWALPNVARSDNVFLHVGQLSVRKGTHRLLRAWKKLQAHRTCELRLIGSMRLTSKFLADFQGTFTHLGQVPRQALRRHYCEAACFVLPAIAEGFAVVILEALSCGTPLAVSNNSGAAGFLDDNRQGLLFDAQDDDQLCTALEWMLSHPHERSQMSECSLAKARSWTWNHYRQAFLEIVEDIRLPAISDRNGAPCHEKVATHS